MKIGTFLKILVFNSIIVKSIIKGDRLLYDFLYSGKIVFTYLDVLNRIYLFRTYFYYLEIINNKSLKRMPALNDIKSNYYIFLPVRTSLPLPLPNFLTLTLAHCCNAIMCHLLSSLRPFAIAFC